MKSNVRLNRLLLGGLEGTHYQLTDKGTRLALEESKNYAWNNWAWAINRQDEPDEAGLDERQIVINKNLNVNEYHPAVSGFTFDPKKVETEYTVVKSIIDEYKQSFALGIYGDNTEAEFASFRKKLNAAGIDKVTEELKAQYQNYLQRNINLLSIYDSFSSWNYGVLIAKTTSLDIQSLKVQVEQHKIDGVVLTRTIENDLAVSYLKKHKIPFVVIGSWTEKEVLQVDFDQEGGCRDLASVLLRMNIKRIACICGDEEHIVTQSRLKGIHAAYLEADAVMEKELIYTGAVYPSIVEKDVIELLDKKVECILCLDDNICMGC